MPDVVDYSSDNWPEFMERLKAHLADRDAEIEALKHEAAGHSEALAKLARLGEPDEELVRQFSESAWDGWIHYRDVDEARWSQLTQRQQGAWMLAMRAAITEIAEKLT